MRGIGFSMSRGQFLECRERQTWLKSRKNQEHFISPDDRNRLCSIRFLK